MDIPVSLIEGSIDRGDILLSEFDGIDHQKFFVVMGVSEDKVCGFSSSTQTSIRPFSTNKNN